MKVLVLMGSDSPEREVSLRSGMMVVNALSGTDHDVKSYDPADGDDGLRQAIEWADVVLPIIHGQYGEDGSIQRLLDRMGKKYLGSGVKACEDSYNKDKAHEILSAVSIKMPRYEVVNAESFLLSELMEKPYVLKPVGGGSSLGLVVARVCSDGAKQKSQKMLQKYDMMLLEELIEGIEITVAIVDHEVLPPVMIVPPTGDEFDYNNKYNGESQEICPIPEGILSNKIQEEAKELALRAHQVLGVRNLSRTDMIVRPSGQIVVLELNTMPGLTDQSLLPKAAAATGMDMAELVEKFISIAAV